MGQGGKVSIQISIQNSTRILSRSAAA